MPEVALTFHGPIAGPATTRLRNAICNALNGGFTGQNNPRPARIYLLLSSAGGVLYDGFSLYGLLKTIGIEVVTVNMGYVASIANVVFLGGSRRFALPESFFQFHGYEWGFDSAHVMGPHNFAFSTQALDAWKHNTKLLLKAHTKLTDADLQKLKLLEEPGVIDAATAKTHGIVQEVGIPPMPAGTPMINVDY